MEGEVDNINQTLELMFFHSWISFMTLLHLIFLCTLNMHFLINSLSLSILKRRARW